MILSAGLRAIPDELYESAALDGAGTIRRHFYITVPMMADVIAIFALLGFVFSVKLFDIVFIMTAGGPANSTQVLGTYAYELAFQFNQWGDSAAVSNVMLILSVALSLVYIKFSGRRGALAS
jgi:multiple sugar transport system permease protein